MNGANRTTSPVGLYRAQIHLHDHARRNIDDFITACQNSDGGFRGRTDVSDLYYTFFGISTSLAIGRALPAMTGQYLQKFADLDQLDFVHLCSLARCWAALEHAGATYVGPRIAPGLTDKILGSLECYRSGDSGYHQERGAIHGSIYACFLAYQTYADLSRLFPQPHSLLPVVNRLQNRHGGYANYQGVSDGTTSVTAAAIVLLWQLQRQFPSAPVQWLLDKCYRHGGFLANPSAPLPDLLSTATALHALTVANYSLAAIENQCRNFIQAHWHASGAFFAHLADPMPDCEYTFYGLLALSSL